MEGDPNRLQVLDDPPSSRGPIGRKSTEDVHLHGCRVRFVSRSLWRLVGTRERASASGGEGAGGDGGNHRPSLGAAEWDILRMVQKSGDPRSPSPPPGEMVLKPRKNLGDFNLIKLPLVPGFDPCQISACHLQWPIDWWALTTLSKISWAKLPGLVFCTRDQLLPYPLYLYKSWSGWGVAHHQNKNLKGIFSSSMKPFSGLVSQDP